MKRRVFFTWMFLFVAVCHAFAGEVLVYGIHHREQSGRLVRSWTEVFSVAANGGAPVRLFSDESLPIELAPSSSSATFPHRKLLLAAAASRTGDYSRATSIYSIELDGSGRYNKLIDVAAGERVDELFTSTSGDKFAYLSHATATWSLFIHDGRNGRLLHRINLSRLLGGCNVDSMGWLNDDRTLYLNVSSPNGDPDVDDPSLKQLGAWLFREDGTGQDHLTARLAEPQLPGYRRIGASDEPAQLIGQLPSGEFVFTLTVQKWPAEYSLLRNVIATAGLHSAAMSPLPLDDSYGPPLNSLLSPSGKNVAYGSTGETIKDSKTLFIRPLSSGHALSVEKLPKNSSVIALYLFGWID
jgi:hypothetical protein